MAPTIMMLSTFCIKLEITFILVEIFDPPIIQVTGSFLFFIIKSKCPTALFIKLSVINFNILSYFVNGCLFSM